MTPISVIVSAHNKDIYKKKTNVITLHSQISEYNFGNCLQSYALNKALEKIGVENKLVCFRNFSIRRKLSKVKSIVLRRNLQSLKRKKIYSLFYRNINVIYKNASKMRYKNNTYYICGSDQIWNPSFAGTAEFFAYGADNDRRIAYAASIGVSELSADTKKKYSEYLRGMKYISVREEAAAELVYEMTERNVPVLCDPTMLLSKQEWETVSKSPEFNTGKYILTYFLGKKSREYSEYISSLAESLNCEVINLERFNPNDYWYSVGPAEFIWLINHCELMCTDSFHGSVFSILMQKPFLVFERLKSEMPMNSRLDTLLKKTDLKNRVFNNQTIEAAINIDYKNVSGIIENEKRKAINYLKNALGVK